MLLNQYEIEQVTMERIKDALREAERARLIREVKGGGEPARWGLGRSILKGLRAGVIPAILPGYYRSNGLYWSAPHKTVRGTPSGHTAECTC
jgi:hypothetical protein